MQFDCKMYQPSVWNLWQASFKDAIKMGFYNKNIILLEKWCHWNKIKFLYRYVATLKDLKVVNIYKYIHECINIRMAETKNLFTITSINIHWHKIAIIFICLFLILYKSSVIWLREYHNTFQHLTSLKMYKFA